MQPGIIDKMRRFLLLCTTLFLSYLIHAQGNGLYCFETQQNTVNLDFAKIDNYYKRLHLLYSINNDDRFLVMQSEEYGQFYITAKDDVDGEIFINSFETFLNDKRAEFLSFDKTAVAELEEEWKNSISDLDMLSLTMDIINKNTPRTENDSCFKALPFCTDVGLYQFPAGVNSGQGESGPNYRCLSSVPNPAWYYMRIDNPGDINIYMYSNPQKDIDFCCWGPFDDPLTPCPNGLTLEKVTSCSFSPNPTENCSIPASAEQGDYYILVITNYSNHPCDINFSKTGGTGTTDCSILPPAISYNNICYGETLHLSAQAVSQAAYSWTGPNGFTSNEREPSIPNVTFEHSGTYECSITIPGQGSSDPMSIDVDILPQVESDFDHTGPCSGYSIQFTGMETTIPEGCNNQINHHLWNFGDGSPEVDTINPTYIYENPGNYEVTYTVVTTNSTGDICSDVRTKTIEVTKKDKTYIKDAICFGESYNQNGFQYTSPSLGIINDSILLQNQQGCDSTVYLELTVTERFENDINDFICFGESYHENNFDLDEPSIGVHTMTQELTSLNGCDSIVTLTLTVAQHHDTTLYANICFGESYTENNFIINTPDEGSHNTTANLKSMYGCDSIVTLNLYVAPVHEFYVVDSICQGEKYEKYGLVYDAGQPDVISLNSTLETETYKCDSIYNVTLKIKPKFEKPKEIYGEKYVGISSGLWNGLYHYEIDPIPYCDDYKWTLWTNKNGELTENTDWVITPNGNKCDVIATTLVESILKVEAQNDYCGNVSQEKTIIGSYYDIEETQEFEIAVYPNPFDDFINVECKNIKTVKLFNITGQTVIMLNFNNEDNVKIDLGGLNNAIYLLEVTTDKGTGTTRISRTNH